MGNSPISCRRCMRQQQLQQAADAAKEQPQNVRVPISLHPCHEEAFGALGTLITAALSNSASAGCPSLLDFYRSPCNRLGIQTRFDS